ncbi:MAG: hypothetical protein WA707_00465, partial [Pseudolabrys sp.]
DRRGCSAHLIERLERPQSTTAEAFKASAFLLADGATAILNQLTRLASSGTFPAPETRRRRVCR